MAAHVIEQLAGEHGPVAVWPGRAFGVADRSQQRPGLSRQVTGGDAGNRVAAGRWANAATAAAHSSGGPLHHLGRTASRFLQRCAGIGAASLQDLRRAPAVTLQDLAGLLAVLLLDLAGRLGGLQLESLQLLSERLATVILTAIGTDDLLLQIPLGLQHLLLYFLGLIANAAVTGY